MIDFIIWALAGCLVIGSGIHCFLSREAVGLFQNGRKYNKVFEVTDVQGYNRATGRLDCVFGILFILLGIPLLDGQNSSLVLIPVCGVFPWSIAWIGTYELVICRKYEKKQNTAKNIKSEKRNER